MKQFDFIGKRKTFGMVSVVLVIASLALIMTKGVNRSVDFAGGTQLTVKFKEDYQTNDLRGQVAAVDSKASIYKNQVQNGSEFTIKIKQPDVEKGKEAEASRERFLALDRAFEEMTGEEGVLLQLLGSIDEATLVQALIIDNPLGLVDTEANIQNTYTQLAQSIRNNLESSAHVYELAQKAAPENALTIELALHMAFPALNRVTADLLGSYLQRFDPLNRGMGSSYQAEADALIAYRETQGDFISDLSAALSQLNLPAESAEAMNQFATSHFRTGAYAIASNETFSPTVAQELLENAIWAIAMALIGILLYISMRFTMGYALASVAALAHDVIIALGAFSLVQAELSNPVVAAFLTIVGYSLNDTIVVFDRIRDNAKGKDPKGMAGIVNTSINETLSRTMVTSITTLFVVLVIFLGANATLSDFAFPLLVGIVIGTYSSIFVASPLALLWHDKVKPINA